MESFYSSDEEVAWGPLNFKEIKGNIKRPLPYKPQRRYTTHQCISKIDFDNTMPPKIENKMEALHAKQIPTILVQEDSIPEISVYLNASEINCKTENISSDYHSAVEHFENTTTTMKSARENSVYSNTEDFVDENIEKHLGYTRKDTSCLNFTKNAMERQSDFIFKNEHCSFVESPNCTPDTSSENMHQNISGNIIVISSDDDDEDPIERGLSCVLEVSTESIENSCCTEKDCSKEEEICEVESYYKDSITNDSRSHISSPVSIPEIDLHQFNESSDFPLNDTLEKITAILNQADAIPIQQDKKVETKSDIIEAVNYSQTCNLIAGSFLKDPDFKSAGNHVTNNNTPKKNVTPSKSNIPIPKKSPNSPFRMPNIPNKKYIKSNFKDIVSPVRMYIKYSPKPILKQNVHSNDAKLSVSPRVVTSKNKENIDVFPNIIYKPSKNQIVASEKNICLPASLDKMIIKSGVTRHEKKPIVNLFKNVSLDAESELTRASFSDSQLGDSFQNMSILHKTPALKK